jgi:hypothetical protein
MLGVLIWQVLIALADQALFGAEPPQSGGTGEAWRCATEPYASLPWIAGKLVPLNWHREAGH